MKPISTKGGLMIAAAIALLPAPALAKDNLAERAQDLAAQANDVQEQAGALANEAANADATREGSADAADLGDGNANRGTNASARDDGDGFPWGLLGLLGLAGLLGLKRNDRDGARRDPHVYSTDRDNPRP
jgi:hypothetical protein